MDFTAISDEKAKLSEFYSFSFISNRVRNDEADFTFALLILLTSFMFWCFKVQA